MPIETEITHSAPSAAELTEAYYRYAASTTVLNTIEAQAIHLGREQSAAQRGIANDSRLFYDLNHQFWVARYARDYAAQLGGGGKAKREPHARHYVDNDLAVQLRAMVKETLNGQRDAMAQAVGSRF